MPIRFRCVYCDQLLGIARRKAGTVVKCPNCAGQLIVPTIDSSEDPSDPESPTARAEDLPRERPTPEEKTSQAPPPATASVPSSEGGMLFERADFDELLKPALERKEPALAGKASSPARQPVREPAPRPAPLAAFDFSSPPAPAPMPMPAPASAPFPAPAPMPTYAPAPSTAAPRSGILLTPVKLVLLALLIMAAMAFAFGGGLLLGLFLK